jgi:hypothetical protein
VFLDAERGLAAPGAEVPGAEVPGAEVPGPFRDVA